MMNGGPVSWRSKQQKIVATSTCHAEYVSACEACRECVWLRELLSEMGFELKDPTTMFEDNESATFISNNPVSSDRSKHFRLRWHYLRQCVRDGTCILKKVNSKDNAADALTKPVGSKVFEMFNVNIGAYTSKTREEGGC